MKVHVFNYKFTNCLLRFDNNNLEGTGNYNFNDTNFYEENVFNQFPDFKNPSENLMRIGEDSAAKGIGDADIAAQVPNDILGFLRSSSIDVRCL